MLTHFDFQVHFFLKFPLQAISRSFSKFQSTTGKLRIIFSPDKLVRHKHLPLIVDQNSINANIEHQNIFFRRNDQPMINEITKESETGI